MNESIISKEFRYPTPTSKKKRWYYTFLCDECGKTYTKVYRSDNPWNCVCRNCKTSSTTKEFIHKSKEKFGDLLDYSKTVYVNKRTDVILICKIHGVYSQNPSDHLAKDSLGGCKLCSAEHRSQAQTYSVERWCEILHAKNPLVHIIRCTSLGYNGVVYLYCELHGEFTTNLRNVSQNKYVCNSCANAAGSYNSRRNCEDRTALVYLVYFPEHALWKVGVTSRTVEERFKGEIVESVWTIPTTSEKDAYSIERIILQKYDSLRLKGLWNPIKSGNSELLLLPIKCPRALME